jgi:CDP-diglyceride synthetase
VSLFASPRGVRDNGRMPAPELAPRRTVGGIVAVWVVAAVAGVAIGVLVPEDWRAAWLLVALGGCLVLSFAVQLWYGRSQQFIERVAASVLGALVVLGVISAGFGLAAIIPR